MLAYVTHPTSLLALDVDYLSLDRIGSALGVDLVILAQSLLRKSKGRCYARDSATEDEWADPLSEFLCAAAVSDVWNFHRVPGLVIPADVQPLAAPVPDELDALLAEVADEPWDGLIFDPAAERPNLIADHPFHSGSIAYHQRTGSHFMSRTDWLWHMEYREKHGV